MISSVEPAVGDKRPREDDGLDRASNPPPANRTSATAHMQSIPGHNGASTQMSISNSNYNASTAVNQTMGGGGSQQMMNGVGGGMYDALYIGDLQWVRLSCRLASCAYRSEMGHQCCFFSLPLSFFLCTVDDR